MHSIVTKPNQEATFTLTNPQRQNPGTVKIKTTEKKSDYGKTECQFNVSLTSTSGISESMFFIISSSSAPGKFTPVFKSENQKGTNKYFKWGRVFTNTDKLANSNDSQQIMIKAFKYDNSGNGNHKK